MNLQAPKYVLGQEDFVWDVDFVQDVLRPNSAPNAIGYPWFLPAILEPANQPVSMVRSQVDATPPMMMANRMGAYFAPHCASFKVEWSLDPDSPFVNGRLNGTSEVFWFDPGDKGDTQRLTFKGPDPLYSLQKRVDELKSKSDAASKALRNRLESLLCEQVVHTDGSAYSLADRFRGETCDMQTDSDDQPEPDLEWEQLSPDKERPNLAAFTALRPTGKCSVSSRSCLEDDDCPPGQTCGDGIPVADDIWPAALRITVDMYDRQGRLERPIRHVMVIPVGN